MAQQISMIPNLPPEAGPMQNAAVALSGQLAPAVADAQQKVQQFVQTAVPLLTNVLNLIDSIPSVSGDAQRNAILVQARQQISQIQSAAGQLSPVIASTDSTAVDCRQKASNLAASIPQVENVLQGNIAAAKSTLQADQQEVNEINSKKYYWLLLGPFGLVGLGIAIGMLVTANNKVSQIEGQISALNLQISQFSKMQVDVEQLRQDVVALADKIQSVKNAVDIVGGDIQSILTDAALGSQAKVFLLALKGELGYLASAVG
ncbi:MAG: hypothetical protein JO323_08895 [Acidobacteriia bacterium]|nr:hypothetical protein [Terriglobia bacterium]